MKKRLLYYGIWAAVLFLTEIIIGTWLNDVRLIRSYGGDVLVIPLLYCLIRLFTDKWQGLLPFLVCCIGFVAELLQAIHLSDLLGFERGSLMAVLIGTSASWWDVLCYIIGMVLLYLAIGIRSFLTKK